MTKTKYINIVSGKGGTGKTLLCTILAELLGNQNVNVLIIDMDIFVRGLTALLYFQKGESLKLTTQNELTVSDIFYRQKSRGENLAIHKYRSFDICPAVERINQIFDYERDDIFDSNHNDISFHIIMDLIPHEKYDYVFFDCRAGYDNLISTIHEKSDITICVQEEDDISDVTANNLIRQLERDSSRKEVFKIINKARNIKSFADLENKQQKGLMLLGHIPFDMDVMNSFGERSFWDDISRSLYKAAVAECWNKLVVKAELNHLLNYKRYNPLVSDQLERPFTFLTSPNRVIALMGLMMGILGLTYTILGENIVYLLSRRPDQLIGFVITFVGFTTFIYSFLRPRK